MRAANPWVELNARLLRGWPLPPIASDADKEERGQVLVVAGSREIAGAAVLAGTAALRAGAGKLVIATGQSVAAHVAVVVPEARVIALPETREGSFRLDSVTLLTASAKSAAAVLVGPGLMDEIGSSAFVSAFLPLLARVPVVLDALAMNVAMGKRFEQSVLLTPHAGEMAHLRGCAKEAVESDAPASAFAAAHAWNAVVALKGAHTLISAPHGGQWRHAGGHPGLATSGSGDVLAGLITGIAARGAPLAQACAWGVVLHALAGRQLAREKGPVGYLARELADAVPGLLKKLERPGGLSRAVSTGS